jgi:hypothetical protein
MGELSRDQQRSRRRRQVRALSISVRRISKRALELGKLIHPETDHDRPKTRAECAGGARPCPYVSCRYHLYLDVDPRIGTIKLNYPDLEPEELAESCSLDVADRGAQRLEDVGGLMNVTRERIRQIEVRALALLFRLRRRLPLVTDFEGKR